MLGDVSACLYAGGNIRQSSIDPSNLVLSFVGEKLNVPLYNGNVPPHPPTTHNGWCVRGGGGQVCSMEGVEALFLELATCFIVCICIYAALVICA